MALLAQAAFGLRRKEAVCLIPSKDYLAGIGALSIVRGTKGGRPRVIDELTEWQFEVIAILIEFCHRGRRRETHIGGIESDLKSNLRRYSYVVGSKLGITRDLVGTTGHGLRAGFACRLLAAHGITAPVKGGDVGSVNPEVRELAYKSATEALGHSRANIVGAYVGSMRMRGDAPHPPRQDLQRIDPPNMDELIATLRQRRAAFLAEDLELRTFAKKVGFKPKRRML
jgi:integrase